MIDFSRPSLGHAEENAVLDVLRSGWLTSGPQVQAFEREIERVVGCKAYATASATLGFQTLLLALGVGPGWKVCFPAVTFSGMPMQARLTGATVQIVDIDEDGFMVLPCTWECAAKQIVVPTHLAGAVAPMQAIRSNSDNFIMIEDCAHLYPGFESGSYIAGACLYSDYSIFSFYPTKCVAAAEGGAVTTAKDLPLNTTRLHGFDRVASELYCATSDRWRYDVVSLGTKANLSDVSAAIALVQLSRVEDLTRRRRIVSSWYLDRLSGAPVRVLHSKERRANRHAEHLMIVLLPSGIDREDVFKQLRSQGIASSLHFQALQTFSFWRKQIEAGQVEVCGNLERAESYSRSALSLPLFADMTEEQVQHVCDVLLRSLG